MLTKKGLIALGVVALLLSASVAWAAEDVTLITGFDSGDYEPYKKSVVLRVQGQLADLGLYHGPIDGQLSQETMEALSQFQREHDLVMTGLPTPRTRQQLHRAAGTDKGPPPQREK